MLDGLNQLQIKDDDIEPAFKSLLEGNLSDANVRLFMVEKDLIARKDYKIRGNSEGPSSEDVMGAISISRIVRGYIAMMHLQYSEAIDLMQNAVDSIPTIPKSHVLLKTVSDCHWETPCFFVGRYRKDISLLRKAISTYETALAGLADCYCDVPQWAKIHVNLGYAHWWIADITSEMSNLPKAATAFKTAVRERAMPLSAEERSDSENQLGIVLTRLDDNEGAAAAFKQADDLRGCL